MDAGPFGMEGFNTTVLNPDITGLPMAVGALLDTNKLPVTAYLSVSQHPGKQYRLEHTFHATLEEEPRVTGNPGFTTAAGLGHLLRFIRRNLRVLLLHWEDSTDSIELLTTLKQSYKEPGVGANNAHVFG